MTNILINNTNVVVLCNLTIYCSCVSMPIEETWKTSLQVKLVGKLLGEVNVQVKLNSLTTNLKIFIALGVKKNILGRDWIFQLNLENESLPKIQRFKPNGFSLQVQEFDKHLNYLINVDVNKCSKTPARLHLKKYCVSVFRKARTVLLALKYKDRE